MQDGVLHENDVAVPALAKESGSISPTPTTVDPRQGRPHVSHRPACPSVRCKESMNGISQLIQLSLVEIRRPFHRLAHDSPRWSIASTVQPGIRTRQHQALTAHTSKAGTSQQGWTNSYRTARSRPTGFTEALRRCTSRTRALIQQRRQAIALTRSGQDRALWACFSSHQGTANLTRS